MKHYLKVEAAVLVCGIVAMSVFAAQNTTITTREVRNPNELKAWLEANATDAESRLDAAGAGAGDTLTLNNPADAGTARIIMQADKGDDAGDKWGIIATDGSGLLLQSDASSKGTLATKVTVGTTGILTLPGGGTIDNATSATILNLTETTVAITGNQTVSGTSAITGGLTVTEDVAITLDATDEEIAIAQSNATGASGTPLISINDDRTGANANEASEATIAIDAEGVYGIAINDGALYVEGASELVGNVTMSGDIDIDGGDITCPADLKITPTGSEVHIDGGLSVGDTTAVGDNNFKVVGTSAFVGVATFSALPVFNAGLDVNEDIDIDFDAADEEVNITTSVNPDSAAGAGMLTLYDAEDANSANSAYMLRIARKNNGGANNEFILVQDNSTGAAGNGDTMFAVNDGGAVVAAGTVDAAGFTADAAAGLDTQSAGALKIGAATATSVEVGQTDAVTKIMGGIKGAYVAKTANYTNTVDDFAISYTTAAATTNTLPEASTALGSMFVVSLFGDTGDLVVVTDGTDKFDGAGNDIITFADAGDSVIVMATGADAYTILSNTGGTLSGAE